VPFVPMPSDVSIPDMPVRPDDWRSWTLQPGTPFRSYTLASPTTGADLEPERKAVHVPMASSGGGTTVKLRDYQAEAIDAVRVAWQNGAKAPLIVLSTGAGKTVVAAEIMARVNAGSDEKCLFLAHREELLSQTVSTVRLVSPNTRVGLVQQKNNELGREITVASVATVGHKSGNRLKELVSRGPYRLVIIDECHHATAAQYTRVIAALREANPDVLLLGLTATPGRADGTALDRVFDVVAYEKNIFDLVNRGWLVPPRGFDVPIDIDLDQEETENGDYVVTQLSKLMNKPPVIRAVVEAWRAHGLDRKFLVFAVDVQHAHALAAEFRDAGYAALAVDGSMKKKERRAALDAFRQGQVKLLVSCNVLSEGYDDPSAEGVLLARPTQSQALMIQQIGRGLRLHPTKTECLVIDCVGNSKKHRPVQLASLAGLSPVDGFGRGGGSGEETDDVAEEAPVEAGVSAAALGHVTEVSFGAKRQPRGSYQWRETTLGWVLQIPKVGYYLVGWSDATKHRATIKFFDQRAGKRHAPPREMVRQPVEFDMAYGLVEGEMDRLFRAQNSQFRNERLAEGEDAEDRDQATASLVDLDEGVDEDVVLPDAELMLRDAGWRANDITPKQRSILLDLGVKEKTMPDKCGEASDLITIMRVERDMKMRMPATIKQINYLRYHGLPLGENLTKGMAARAIWMHRKATGR
jgi:superfamily II DNA or RNA helicase